MRRPQKIFLCAVGLLASCGVWAAPEPTFADGKTALGAVLTAVDRRLELMPQIAAFKWQSHLPVRDASREALVLEEVRKEAAALGLAPESVESLFALQLELARALQQRLLGEWNSGGERPAGGGPSLGELRPKIDALTHEQLQELYVWAGAESDGSRAPPTAPELEQLLPSTRWRQEERARLLAAIDAVRIQGQGSLARAKRAGLLRIATTGDYPPFSEKEASGRLRGVDVDLALSLADELHLRPQFVRTSWRNLVTDLQAGRFDIAVGGISVTAQREANGAFSPGLFRGGKTAIGRCADASRFRSLKAIDRAGIRVVYNRGGTNEAFARNEIHRAEIHGIDDNQGAFQELLQRRADVMFTDDTEVELQHRRHPQLCRLLSQSFMPAVKAFFMPRDAELQHAVSSWAQQSIQAREPKRRLARYLDEIAH